MANTKIKSIALGSDHGGFHLKENIRKYLTENGYKVTDCGTSGTDAVDYPEFAFAVAKKVSAGGNDIGIIVDGAGIGSSMVANKVPGVRAALCYDLSTARNAREHNNANVLTLGAGMVGFELAKQVVSTFLSTDCTVERHLRRVSMIDRLDAPVTPGMESLSDISENDLKRIAERVDEMLKQSVPASKGEKSPEKEMVCSFGVKMERKPETIRKFLDFGVERIGYGDNPGEECLPEDIARCIDHTVLKPVSCEEDIRKICREAREFQFASVCISPSYVPLAATELAGSPVKVCTVVGFPSGAHMPEIKALETRRAIRDGAKEIDMVINIGALKSGNKDLVYKDIRMVCEACEDGGAISKVIIEAALLTDEEKVIACGLSKKARANFVKTSTGFGPHGATAEDVALMKSVVGEKIEVKAAGGIRSYEDAQKMIRAGATRIGASASIKIVHEAKSLTESN